jgi:hypothetical protein
MFDEYRPPWAVAKALEGRVRTHLRSGWSFDIGFETHCGSVLKFPEGEYWVSAQDIEEHDIASTDSNKRTCGLCCYHWLRKAEKNRQQAEVQ